MTDIQYRERAAEIQLDKHLIPLIIAIGLENAIEAAESIKLSHTHYMHTLIINYLKEA